MKVPPELLAAFVLRPEAREWWDGLTPAARGIASTWIGRAKNPQVREWRAEDVLRRARRYHLKQGPFYPTREDQRLLARPRGS